MRELLRYRAFLVRQRTRVKNAIHALLARENIDSPYSDLFGKAGLAYLSELELHPLRKANLEGYLRLFRFLGREIEQAERRVKREFRESSQAKLLSTMPGIGHILALTILSEIGDIARFRSAKQLSSYAGLCPSVSQSGGRVRHGRITRQGSRWLRWALVEAAIHAAGRPGPLRDAYLRISKRKGNKVARVAVARKMATYVFHMLKENRTFAEIISSGTSDLR